jgi:Flp pilus assembly protein TadG
MIALRKFAADLRSKRDGSTTVEFALVAPIMIMFVVGGLYLSMMGFTAASLRYAAEAGARCRSVNTTVCTDAATTQTFAATQFIKTTSSAPSFVATTELCGNQVVGTVTFNFSSGMSKLNVPFSATACFPS